MKFDRRRKPTIKSLVVAQSVTTSVSLEGAFWNALKEIAVSKNISINVLVSKIDTTRKAANLSSAIRVYVLSYYKRLV
jgi:predicted DNA-binding ribbon-helix-helix protein